MNKTTAAQLRYSWLVILLALPLLLGSCNNIYVPRVYKPKAEGYFRKDIPLDSVTVLDQMVGKHTDLMNLYRWYWPPYPCKCFDLFVNTWYSEGDARAIYVLESRDFFYGYKKLFIFKYNGRLHIIKPLANEALHLKYLDRFFKDSQAGEKEIRRIKREVIAQVAINKEKARQQVNNNTSRDKSLWR